MEEPLPVLETPPDAPQPRAMSLAARLLNVFAIPGEVFEVVRAKRFAVGNWLLPAVLSALVGVGTVIVVFSQPSIQQAVRGLADQQAKGLEQQVKAGSVTRTDADRAEALTTTLTQPATLKTLLGVVVVLVSVVRVFWWAFVLWLLGRVCLKAPVNYLKTLEVAGLALMISVLGAFVLLLLMVNLPRLIATPGLAVVVPDFDATRKSPLLLGTANVFAFWLVGVLSVGLARLARVPFLRAAWFVFAAWVVQQCFLLLLGGAFGQFVL